MLTTKTPSHQDGDMTAKTGTVPRIERSEGLSPAFAPDRVPKPEPDARRQSPVANSQLPLWLVLCGLLALAGLLSAQPAHSQGPVFKYYVWGQVRTPGAYSLGGNPDIVELLSAAGGPTQYADVRHVVLVRASTQKRIRVDLKRMLGSGQVVPLSPGDVVMVPDSPWYTMRYAFDVATTVTSFATLAITILIFAGVGR